MKLTIFQADAFSSRLFGGNPAAVIPLKTWLPDELMQQIALENNLSETAFFVREDEHFHIRWFTPATEVNLCGHATLATAHIIFSELGYEQDEIRFMSKSGELLVKKEKDMLALDFPAQPPQRFDAPQGLIMAMQRKPLEVYKAAEDYLLVYGSENDILALKPDFNALADVKCRGVICTAKGEKSDFVSRFFAPAAGINEDPVTGSAHTRLIPYWADRLKKKKLHAFQLSVRKGELFCELQGDRVRIAGHAVTYMKGEIYL